MADDAKPVKVLIAGDVEGNFDDLFKRVGAVNDSQAGPFDLCVCVGRFFGGGVEDDAGSADGGASTAKPNNDELRPYVDGTSAAPMPTYFVDALPRGREFVKGETSAAQKGADSIEVAPNVRWLCRPGVHDLHGLRVAVLPGKYNKMAFEDASAMAASAAAAEGEFTMDDVSKLRASAFRDAAPPGGANGGENADAIDLFLTTSWPKGVELRSRDATTPDVVAASAAGSAVVADLARDLQPRYHACGAAAGCPSKVFYAREPYKNQRAMHVTRFLALAPVRNDAKHKWLHALGLVPARVMPPSSLRVQPPDATRSPYDAPPPPPGSMAAKGAALAAQDAAFDHASLRWEEPKAKRARLAANIDRRPLQGDTDKTVYVRNLAYRADEGALAEFFGQCGELVDLRLGRGDDGRSRGFCHVAYKTVDGAEKALQLSDTSFYGRDIVVQMAKSEEERNAERDARRANRPPPPPPQGCWFCLSNEKDTHLVASIASESFVSMDKAGVVADHCQIVPIEHAPSFAAMAPSAAEEMWRYLDALRKCFAAGGGGDPPSGGEDGTDNGRDVVVFERHLALRSKGGNHCHVNVVPVPRARSGKAKKIFEQAAKKLNFEWSSIPKPESAMDAQAALLEHVGDGEYYAVHLPDGSILVRKIGRGEPHWMSFGREVLGHLLGCPERTSWQECLETEEKETARAAAMKASFEKFDIMQE